MAIDLQRMSRAPPRREGVAAPVELAASWYNDRHSPLEYSDLGVGGGRTRRAASIARVRSMTTRDVAPSLVWPQLLQRPSHDASIVYFDLNHWIYLAQQVHGRSDSAGAALEACRTAKARGTGAFVLSASHYAEMLKIKDPKQRRAIAHVMEELTDFASLVSRVVVMELEIGAVLDRISSTESNRPPVPLISRGVRHAFGLQSGLRIMGPAGDESDRVREQMGAAAFDEFVAKANLMLERGSLRGPADDEVEKMRALGWCPEEVLQVAEKRAAEERNQMYRLDGDGGRWRRGRLRDVVAARELLIEFQTILPRALAERQLSLQDVMSDPQSANAFVRAMPSTEVSIQLKTAWHRNRYKGWTANDIYDIDAMALAVPYCDVVVTEKACHHALTTAGLGPRMHTSILRQLCDLPGALQQWKPARPTAGGTA